MAKFSITLPVPPDKIASECKRIHSELKRIQQEEQALIGFLEAIQSSCPHKGNTWGRWPFTQCKICGKEL